jgi:hypothetical protein
MLILQKQSAEAQEIGCAPSITFNTFFLLFQYYRIKIGIPA